MSYKIGNVYRIICLIEPNLNYIGSTFDTLRNRWQNHKSKFLKNYKKQCCIKPYFEKYGIENFKIILIKEYKVVDKKHLEAYEQLWINKTKCVNEKSAFTIPFVAKKKYYLQSKEYMKTYKNMEKRIARKKEWMLENRDVILEKAKKRREEKRDEINEKQNEKITCECGCIVARCGRKRHEKTKKHLNLMSKK
jgi:hypothetical protein